MQETHRRFLEVLYGYAEQLAEQRAGLQRWRASSQPVSQNARPNDTYKRNPGVAPLKNKAKMSAIFKEMALTLFRVPEALPSSEAAHATLLLTHVAWNRALGETFTDAECRRILRKFEKSRPALWAELRSHDWKSMINDLIEYKKKRYPYDKRIVVVCGINPKKNIHVEWHYPSSSDVHV